MEDIEAIASEMRRTRNEIVVTMQEDEKRVLYELNGRALNNAAVSLMLVGGRLQLERSRSQGVRLWLNSE